MECIKISAINFVIQLVEVGNFLSRFYRDPHPPQANTQKEIVKYRSQKNLYGSEDKEELLPRFKSFA